MNIQIHFHFNSKSCFFQFFNLKLDNAPVAQWIECWASDPEMGVQIPPGAHVLSVYFTK